MKHLILLAGLIVAPAPVLAADTTHMSHAGQQSPNAEAGQSAFAAIAEIVALLESDPATDWSKVDVQALRDHLADMDRVTLNTRVEMEPAAGGAVIVVKGDGETALATQRMMLAHAPFLAAATGFTVKAQATADGATWRVVSARPADQARIRALGFYGLLAVGAHHQPHHLALARGAPVH